MIHIKKADILSLINQGVSKELIHKQLYPELNKTQWRKVLRECGLNLKRVPKVGYVIDDISVDDTLNNVSSTPNTTSATSPADFDINASDTEDDPSSPEV